MSRDLGSVFQTGISDATLKVNPYLLGTGWDVQFPADQSRPRGTEVEIWHIALDGPIGSSAVWFRNNRKLGYINQGWANEWDPSQPVLLGQTDEITFCWNVAFAAGPYNKTSNILPEITLWLRQPQEW